MGTTVSVLDLRDTCGVQMETVDSTSLVRGHYGYGAPTTMADSTASNERVF